MNLRSITRAGARWVFLVVLLVAATLLYARLRRTVDTIDAAGAKGSGPMTAWRLADRLVAANERIASADAAVLYAEVRRREFDGLAIFRPVNWYVYYEVGGSFYYVSSTNKFARDPSASVCGANETPCMIFEAIEPPSGRITPRIEARSKSLLRRDSDVAAMSGRTTPSIDTAGDKSGRRDASVGSDSAPVTHSRTACLTVPFLTLLRLFSTVVPAGANDESVTDTSVIVSLDRVLSRPRENDPDTGLPRRVTVVDLLNELIEQRVL